MLRDIDPTNIGEAAELLGRGFPARDAAFFERGLRRMIDLGWNAEAQFPLGQLLTTAGRNVGVLLTPASVRARPDGTRQTVVNVSSWYMEPDHRWRAAVMLRGAMKREDCIYTDLTPTPEVRRILPALGFQPITSGIEVVALPLNAMQPAKGAAVVDLSEAGPHEVSEPTRRLLEMHRALDCVSGVLRTGDASTAFMVKRRKLKGMPASSLVYCESNERVMQCFGAVARYLLGRGMLWMLIDFRDGDPRRGVVRRLHASRFAKGDSFADRTDYAGSELCLLDF